MKSRDIDILFTHCYVILVVLTINYYIINKDVIEKAFGQWCRNFNWT